MLEISDFSSPAVIFSCAMINKTISVSIPNYNDSQYISQALEAICQQSLTPKEVIIVDDASTDNSIEVIQTYISKYPFIRLLHNETNRGVNFTGNKAASLTTGDFIHFAAANDFVLPGFFEKAVAILCEYPHAALCWTDFLEVDSAGEVIKTHRANFLEKPGYISPKQLSAMFRAGTDRFRVNIGATSSIIRRELLSKDQALTPQLESFGDWIMCQTLACRYGICYIPEPLAIVRRLDDSHSKRTTTNLTSYRQSVAEIFKLLASLEYEDVTPLIIHSRSISKIDPRIRNSLVAFNALRGIKTNGARLLLLYSIEESLRDLLSYVARTLFIMPLGYLKNLYDRAFARCFHEYDKIRTAIKRKLAGY